MTSPLVPPEEPTSPPEPAAGGDLRYRAGVALLVASFVCPLTAIPIAFSSLPTGPKTAIAGFLTVGIPELLTVLSVAVLGKENFTRITQRALGWLGRFKPDRASRRQYYVGVAMMVLPIIPTYVMAYAPQWLPDASPQHLWVNVAADIMFYTGVFVAGGDMWDKIRALFVYDARVEFAPPAEAV